jgi:hypothetical protein
MTEPVQNVPDMLSTPAAGSDFEGSGPELRQHQPSAASEALLAVVKNLSQYIASTRSTMRRRRWPMPSRCSAQRARLSLSRNDGPASSLPRNRFPLPSPEHLT